MKRYTADFETCTWLSDETYVWAWAVCDIDNNEDITIGTDIKEFFEFMKKNNGKYLFHNLKFDGEFIISYLLNNGYKHIKDKKERNENTFTTLISDVGQFYQIEIYFKVGKKNTSKVTINDSLKIIPFPIEDIPKQFGFDIQKLEIDYNKPREKGHQLTDEEKEYIKHDVLIASKALKIFYDENLTKMTIGANALSDFKDIIGLTRFEHLYPNLEYNLDKELRRSYKGGFTYLNDIYAEKDVGQGITLDVNSLYPSVMHSPYVLPYGYPFYFKGKYKEDKVYPLYIQKIRCSFEIKENKIPTIQLKGNYFYKPNEYLKSSNYQVVDLTLTSIDLKLFLEQYEVYDLEYIEGWKFKGLSGMFDSYIDKWTARKIQAGKEGNKGQRQLAKLFLNSLYGKFATSLDSQEKIPVLDENGIVNYELGEKTEKKGIHVVVGAFITAYARNKTIRTSQAITDYSLKKYGKDLYIYSDTDSISTLLPIEEVKQFCDIDDYELGKWAHENTFTRAKFIRQKTYLKEIDGKIHICCAGMPKSCYDFVTWDKFKQGFTCGGKLRPVHLKGGIKLVETDFTLKKDTQMIKNINKF